MTRQLRPAEPPRGARRLESRREIEEWLAERHLTLTALFEAEKRQHKDEQQLELGRAA